MSKKEKILQSAIQILAEKGVHNTPMSAIAKEAGTGMGTIYNHFPNKDILINQLYVDIKKKERLVFVAFDTKKPIKTQFENYFTSLVNFFINNSLYFYFMEQLQASPIISKESKEVGYQSVTPVLHLIEKGQKERIIKDIDKEEILMFIGGAVLSYLRWYFNQSEKRKGSIKSQLQLVWDAIKE